MFLYLLSVPFAYFLLLLMMHNISSKTYRTYPQFQKENPGTHDNRIFLFFVFIVSRFNICFAETESRKKVYENIIWKKYCISRQIIHPQPKKTRNSHTQKKKKEKKIYRKHPQYQWKNTHFHNDPTVTNTSLFASSSFVLFFFLFSGG